MKILTILGTRPEIIRLSGIIAKLDKLSDHVLVHTGQNYNTRLSDIFFEELRVRPPDHYLAAKGDLGTQLGTIFSKFDYLLKRENPDRVLVLGDTNSALAAIVAKRAGIPVFHMEAGNRCYDDRVPEETNRRIIDHTSDILMPYTERSRMNLIREGIEGWRIFVVGNPIRQVIEKHASRIRASRALASLGLSEKSYFLVTLHRAENVDVEDRLLSFRAGFDRLSEQYGLPVVVSTHPRTRARLEEFGIESSEEGIRFLEPFGFFDFISLERSAACVLSDSGTVQEECCIYRIPNVTLRDVTERPETIECGSNVLSGAYPEDMLRAVRIALDSRGSWSPPREYLAEDVVSTVVGIVLGYHCSRIR